MLNLKQKHKLVDLGLIVIGFVLFFEILFYHSAVVKGLTNFVQMSGVWSWVVICLLQFLQVIFIPVPATFITLTSMKMYPDNLFMLFGLTLVVVVAAVVVAYFIGRKWGKKAVIWAAGSEEEYDKWLSVLKSKKTNIFYMLTILLPVFPDDILCLIAGSIKMNFWWYLFTNIICRAIGLATFMFVFKTISNNPITLIVLFVVLITLVVYKIILVKRNKNELNTDRK